MRDCKAARTLPESKLPLSEIAIPAVAVSLPWLNSNFCCGERSYPALIWDDIPTVYSRQFGSFCPRGGAAGKIDYISTRKARIERITNIVRRHTDKSPDYRRAVGRLIKGVGGSNPVIRFTKAEHRPRCDSSKRLTQCGARMGDGLITNDEHRGYPIHCQRTQQSHCGELHH